jgi:predicted PolB exonuclease-like 3'-5' exonuclease
MTPVLAFDIETVPDIEGIRRLHGLDGRLADAEVAEMAFQLRRQANGSDFLPLHLHRGVAISCALRERESFRAWSLGSEGDGEAILIQRFFDGIAKYTPQLVSWNGGGFDLPVLHYRGLVHGVRARRYWDCGDDDREFRFNNYISRYHQRHLDLMDLLALYQPRANAPLDDLAQLMGLPGKLGMDGSQVWDAYRGGKLADIRRYCETDVVNTYLVFLRFQLMRECLTAEEHRAECALVRDTLGRSSEPHWKEFLARWPAL